METLQSAACGGVVKKLVIMTSLGVSILASDALAIDLAIKGTASESLAAVGLCSRVMVDCSHDNSAKDYRRQTDVCADLARQIRRGQPILGVMIESNLVEGKQPFPPEDGVQLRYGQSITDGCVALEATAHMLDELADAVSSRPVE